MGTILFLIINNGTIEEDRTEIFVMDETFSTMNSIDCEVWYGISMLLGTCYSLTRALVYFPIQLWIKHYVLFSH